MTSSSKDQGKAIIPIPKEVLDTLFQHKYLGLPKAIWPYHTSDGEIAMYVCRYIKKNGEKSDLPWTYRVFENGKKEWATKSIPKPRLLFNLNKLVQNTDKPVMVCEGEKAAEAASKLFPDYICITSPNGAGNPASSDWSYCLNRDVIIWPDNDSDGEEYAKKVSKLCLDVGVSSVRIVDVPKNFPPKWDLADDLPDGLSIHDLNQKIHDAELMVDPLEDLVERTKNDPGLPFSDLVLQALAELKIKDLPAFEKIRSELKAAKVRVTHLDKAIKAHDCGLETDEDLSQVQILLLLARQAYLFHSPDKIGYADIVINEHRETWPIKSNGFKRWLLRLYYGTTENAPNSEAINAAINTIDAEAYYAGEEHEVFIRVAHYKNKSYLDLSNDEWECIEVDETGWRIITDPPVKFRRAAGMQALPKPSSKGSLDALRSILNVQNESDFILVVSWVITALRGVGPYPVLVLTGEHGTAKSTFSKFIRGLVDPNGAPLRTLREERDMFIAANNGHILAFDNISGMNAATSDTLCRLSTGGALATRQLYSDQDEVLINVVRPIILNGIDDVITRPDLGDRSIVLTLKPIPEEKRRLERELFSEFESLTPAILGALLDAMSHGFENLPNIKLDKLPRMADFALWSSACSKALWDDKEAFLDAFDNNRLQAINDILDIDPVTSALIEFLEYKPKWMCTAQTLLLELEEAVSFIGRPPKQWPTSPRGLSGKLRRAAPFLRKVGIEIIFDEKAKDRNRNRMITISKVSKM